MELEQTGENLLITLTTDAGSYEATNEIILLGVQAADFTSSSYDFYAHGWWFFDQKVVISSLKLIIKNLL